jgi:hypothetical protein
LIPFDGQNVVSIFFHYLRGDGLLTSHGTAAASNFH